MFFSIVYVIDATCFNKCFLFHVIVGRHFYWKFVVTVRFFQPPYCHFLSNKYFERSPYFMHLHNNSAVLILMLMEVPKKAIVYYTCIYLKNFCSQLFCDNVFCTLYFFNCSRLFFIKLFLFWKTQNISESIFYIIL